MIRTFEMTNGVDVILIQILEDGMIVSEVQGQISGPNHAAAEGFVDLVAKLAGGDTTVEQSGGVPHSHEHQQLGETHSH